MLYFLGNPTCQTWNLAIWMAAPNSARGDDSISDPEAALYYDDLTIESGRLTQLVQTLQCLVRRCRLSADW